MTKQEPGWELYRSFLAVADEGSLSRAARALGIAQPTVGRHVDALEEALGLTLFVRSQAGLAPTEAAAALRPYAETLAATAGALLRAAASQGEGVRGVVRITCSEVVGVEVLPPLLVSLRQRHPELVVELVPTNRVEDVLRRDADIAVRMLPPGQQALVARRVGATRVGLHATADYLARHGMPRRWEDLAGHALIGFDRETALTRRLRQQLGPMRREAFALRTDSDLAQLAAIRAGYGIGACQCGLAQRGPRLVRVLPELFQIELDTWLAMHEDLRDNPRCRATFEHLAEGLGRYIAPE